MNFIDLHCHILPGIDDGPKTLKESLEMARIFEEAGYSHVVATPHAVPGTTWMPKPGEIRDLLAELKHAIAKEGTRLNVLPGREIALDPQISALIANSRVQTLAGTSYVLIELPFQRLLLGWEHVIFDVLSKGFAVLLAHPERCAQLTAKPHLCDQLIESGVYFQVNGTVFWDIMAARLRKWLSIWPPKDSFTAWPPTATMRKAEMPGRCDGRQKALKN